MPSPARERAKQQRIGRQFQSVHFRMAEFVRIRQVPFWQRLTDSILAEFSRSHSEHVYIDQVFRSEEWRAAFNAAIIPSLKMAAYAGVQFEAEWVHSATGEGMRQSMHDLQARCGMSMGMTVDYSGFARGDGREDSGGQYSVGDGVELHPIQQGNFSGKITEDFFRPANQRRGPGIVTPGNYGSRDGGNLSPSGRFPAFRQKGIGKPTPGGSGNVPDIGVAMSGQLQASIDQWLGNRSVGVWSKVGNTTKRALQTTIQRGLAEGDSLKDLTARVKSTLTNYTDYEARRVAITETTGAMNFGQHQERIELGIEHKEWISTIDARTRGQKKGDEFDHLSPNGQTARNDVPFIVSGESLMFPGDASLGASAGNLIHCRCAGVGAWPEHQGKGGVKGPKPNPVLPPNITPEDRVSRQSIDAMEAERNTAAMKSAAKQVVALLAKHEKKLEKIRQDVLKVTQKTQAAREVLMKTQEKALVTKSRVNISEINGDLSGARNFKKVLEEDLRQVEIGKRKVIRLEGNERGKLATVLKNSTPGTPATVNLNYMPSVDSAMQTKSETAGAFVGRITDQSAMTRKKPGGLTIDVHVTPDRSGYSPLTKTAYMEDGVGTHVFVHEFAHGVEDYGGLKLAAKGFLYHRTTGDIPAILKKRFPTAGFDPEEVTLEDKFFQAYAAKQNAKKRGAYVGKYYPHGTEILSMGVEQLYTDGVGFAQRDPEFFNFVVACLRGLIHI